MLDVMVDLETLGSAPGCVIMSIGAVPFGPGGLGKRFFDVVVDRASCRAAGLTEDPATLVWWDQQSAEARTVIASASGDNDNPFINVMPLGDALRQLNQFLAGFGDGVRLWGNGSDFDNAILALAYRAVGIDPAWKFWNNRCYRTLKNLRPHIKMQRAGVYHSALDDARSQAEHAVRLLSI